MDFSNFIDLEFVASTILVSFFNMANYPSLVFAFADIKWFMLKAIFSIHKLPWLSRVKISIDIEIIHDQISIAAAVVGPTTPFACTL